MSLFTHDSSVLAELKVISKLLRTNNQILESIDVALKTPDPEPDPDPVEATHLVIKYGPVTEQKLK